MTSGKNKNYVALLTKLFPSFVTGGLSNEEVMLIDEILRKILTQKELEIMELWYGLRDFDVCTIIEIQEKMEIGESYIRQMERQAMARLKSEEIKWILKEFTNSRADLIKKILRLKREKESFGKKVAGLSMVASPGVTSIPLSSLNLTDDFLECFRIMDVEYLGEIPKFSKEDLAEKGINSAMIGKIKALIGDYGLYLRKKKDIWFD